MLYRNKADLDDIRRSPENELGTLCLYGVFTHLGHPVIHFNKMSKKYLYVDQKQYPYPSKSSSLVVFDNKSEAWRFYKSVYEKQKKHIQDQYESDMQKLTRATDILDECAEKTPEYFL